MPTCSWLPLICWEPVILSFLKFRGTRCWPLSSNALLAMLSPMHPCLTQVPQDDTIIALAFHLLSRPLSKYPTDFENWSLIVVRNGFSFRNIMAARTFKRSRNIYPEVSVNNCLGSALQYAICTSVRSCITSNFRQKMLLCLNSQFHCSVVWGVKARENENMETNGKYRVFSKGRQRESCG